MIIERSAFSGVGKYGSRWLGDNFSQNGYMGFSVTGIMMHNIIGIPLAGSDICGFLGTVDAELCARWHVVGAFYPFSRNHNDYGADDQEPYLWNTTYVDTKFGSMSYTDIMREAIYKKYDLISYYYTELTHIHEDGGPFYKPLFFSFPDDDNSYSNQIFNVMLGEALKLSINSQGIQHEKAYYFPPMTSWCNVYDFSQPCFTTEEEGLEISRSSAIDHFDLHIRGGFIVPMHDSKKSKIMKTHDL